MTTAPTRRNEASRLEALRRHAVLDSPPEASFDRITHLASCLFEAPIALISLIDQKRQWFKSRVGLELTEVDREIAFCAHAILSDGVLVVPDTWQDPRFQDNPQVTGAPFIRFYAGAPLVTLDGFRLGAFCIVDTVPRTFSPAQAANLQHFAAMVTETLEARRAAVPLTAALESTASGVVICDPHKPDVPIVFANAAFCAITGYRREEVLGRNCRFLQGPDTDPAAVAQMRAAVAGRDPFHGTLRNYRKDGTPFWNALNLSPVFDDAGELVSFVGVQVDTTAQVEALAQARQSEAQLAAAQRVAQIGSWECAFTASGELDRKSVIWSDETYRLFGLAREAGADLWAHSYGCVHPDDLAAAEAVFAEAIRARGGYSIDHRLVLPDGTQRVVHVEATILLDEATGAPLRLVGTMQDITGRKAAEDALRISEQNYRAFFDANPLPSWVFDHRTLGILEVNAAAVAHYGYSREEFLAMTILDFHSSEESAVLRANFPPVGTGPVRSRPARHRKKDGTVIEVEISGGDISIGGRAAVLAVINDVTERRRTELALRESEATFSGAFTHSPIGAALVSPEGRWLRVNPAFCQLIGYGEAELLRRTVQDITHPEDLELSDEKLRRRATNESSVPPFEKRYVHADGHVINVLISSTLVRGQSGEPSHWVTQIQDISARKRAEQELRWKTAFLEALVDSSSDGIVVSNSEPRLLLQNQRSVELWQIPARLTGMDVSANAERFHWITGMTTEPARFREKLTHLQAHPAETSRDEIILKSGTVLDFYTAPVLGQDGTYYGRIWTYRDITERKRIEESLRESEARYAQIAANIPGIVYRLVLRPDAGLSLPFVSRGCVELYGLEPGEMQRRAAAGLYPVHPDDKQGHLQSMAASAATLEPWNWQGRILRHPTGEIRYVQEAAKPTRKPNGDIVWDGLILDITDRKQAEENLRAKEEAERTNREKSKFLSRMSHELRTPLNAILGFGQVLEFSGLRGEDAQALGYILKGGQHLLSLIDEVLDLSRVESGEMRLEPTSVDAVAMTRECIDLLARLMEARHLRCTVKNPPRPVLLWCDRQRLRQMLLNLLSNAIKYNRERGKITVSFEPAAGGRLRLNVTDTGPGIPPEGIAQLFVPFERLQHESGEVEGTGLGLVVSRRIAEAMDGTVDVTSEVGRGSTFWIELPLAAASAPTRSRGDPPGATAPRTPAPKDAALLYIEDNLSNLRVMEMLFDRQRPGWRFLSARDGQEGLEQARQNLPGAILLDLQLPGISGEEVLKRLRGDPATRAIPVMVLSADATAHSRERLLALGATEYISKPFQVEELLAQLDRVLRHEKEPAGKRG